MEKTKTYQCFCCKREFGSLDITIIDGRFVCEKCDQRKREKISQRAKGAVVEGFREPEQRFSSKSRLNYKGFCLRECAHRDKKCDVCFTYHGRLTEYKPKEGEKNG